MTPSAPSVRLAAAAEELLLPVTHQAEPAPQVPSTRRPPHRRRSRWSCARRCRRPRRRAGPARPTRTGSTTTKS